MTPMGACPTNAGFSGIIHAASVSTCNIADLETEAASLRRCDDPSSGVAAHFLLRPILPIAPARLAMKSATQRSSFSQTARASSSDFARSRSISRRRRINNRSGVVMVNVLRKTNGLPRLAFPRQINHPRMAFVENRHRRPEMGQHHRFPSFADWPRFEQKIATDQEAADRGAYLASDTTQPQPLQRNTSTIGFSPRFGRLPRRYIGSPHNAQTIDFSFGSGAGRSCIRRTKQATK
ncbi:MAG: hypothetical protein HXX15_01000 [Rhodopseudomonas sp.]|nr:hypothetical protein [Rhodopseudomonas sp.]